MSDNKKAPAANTWSSVTMPQLRSQQLRRTFPPSVVISMSVLLGLIYGLVRYTEFGSEPDQQIRQYYMW